MDETTSKIRTAFTPRRLGTWPTACEPAPDLAAALGLAALWVKREDRASPRYGGNKTRGLEFLFAGLEPGTVCVTLGGTGSTHCCATAVHARALGLRSVLVQFPQPQTVMGMALAQASLAAADLVVRARLRVALPFALHRGWHRARRLGPRHWIPGGGATARAVLGHFLAGLELAEQLPQPPDAIIAPLGSTGTAAGLVLAVGHLGWPTRVVGVRVAPWPIASVWRARRLAGAAAELLQHLGVALPSAWPQSTLEVVDGLGRGYGHPTPAGNRASELAARHGLLLDPTYSAKAFAALPEAGRGTYRRIVFWHTFAPPPTLSGAELRP